MTKRAYRTVLSTAQSKLHASIGQIRRTIAHSGEIGSLVEQQFRSALGDVLPEKVGVSHGFVIDSDGRRSGQMDIILYDRLNAPKIFASEGAQIFPVESTYACGEIKTSLDSARLDDSFKKCLSYKNLVRKAYYSSDRLKYHLFGEWHDHWQSIFFCLAVEGIDFNRLQDTYRKIANCKGLDHKRQIDTIIALEGKNKDGSAKSNCLLNHSGNLVDGKPEDRSIDLIPSGDSVLTTYSAKEPWALFVNLLLRYMLQVSTDPVKMLKYDSGEPF